MYILRLCHNGPCVSCLLVLNTPMKVWVARLQPAITQQLFTAWDTKCAQYIVLWQQSWLCIWYNKRYRSFKTSGNPKVALRREWNETSTNLSNPSGIVWWYFGQTTWYWSGYVCHHGWESAASLRSPSGAGPTYPVNKVSEIYSEG